MVGYFHWLGFIGIRCSGILQAHCYCGPWKGVLLCRRRHQQLFPCKNQLNHFLKYKARTISALCHAYYCKGKCKCLESYGPASVSSLRCVCVLHPRVAPPWVSQTPLWTSAPQRCLQRSSWITWRHFRSPHTGKGSDSPHRFESKWGHPGSG